MDGEVCRWAVDVGHRGKQRGVQRRVIGGNFEGWRIFSWRGQGNFAGGQQSIQSSVTKSMSCMAGYAGYNSEDLVKYLVHYLVITVCCAIHYIPLTVISYINGPWTILINSALCTMGFMLRTPDPCTLYAGLYITLYITYS